MAKEYKLSPQRLKELQDELNYLKTVREKEVAELIKEARSFGDLSENSEYDEAKNEQGKLYARIGELEEILANYVVIEEDETEGDYVRLGSIVTVLDKEFDEEVVYKIVGSQEADPMNGAISEDSPFGKALLGKNEGDEVTVDAPRRSCGVQAVKDRAVNILVRPESGNQFYRSGEHGRKEQPEYNSRAGKPVPAASNSPG